LKGFNALVQERDSLIEQLETQKERLQSRISELSRVLELTLTEAAFLSESKTHEQQAQVKAVMEVKSQMEQKQNEITRMKEVFLLVHLSKKNCLKKKCSP
jgi:hypothetical protein